MNRGNDGWLGDRDGGVRPQLVNLAYPVAVMFPIPAFQPSHGQHRAVSELDAILASVEYLSADNAQAIEEVLSRVDNVALFPGVVQIAIQAIGELADQQGTTFAAVASRLGDDLIAQMGSA